MSEEGRDALRALLRDRQVRRMKEFTQHGDTTTYDHCLRVASLSDAINRRFRLHADERTLLTGAMLHDFYLYDWHEKNAGHRLHGFTHPLRAAENAKARFGVDARVEHVIVCHMWPLTLTRLPRTREAWIVCLADKWCSLGEILARR